jgi:membrane protease YdiL (CAAX protease family)
MDEPTTTTLNAAPPVAPPVAPPARRSPWQRYVTDVRRDADAASAAYRATTPVRVADRKMIVVLVTTAVSLTFINFFSNGDEPGWIVSPLRAFGFDGLATRAQDALTTSSHAQFWQLSVWALVAVTGYVVLPVLVVRFLLHERIRDFGLRTRGIAGHAGMYAVLYAIAAPALIVASFGAAFQHRYPFYDLHPAEGLWPYLWAWWALYALQFVALEFFFRGFVVHGLAPRFGYAAVFVMIVPYNMIHYGKPLPEALAAIVGGVVLGTLSLKTKSIWWGAALHISIAATMDVCSLWHRGIFF